jgi:hypothetical protein
MLHVSITDLLPSRLWLLRLLVRAIGGKVVVCQPKRRKAFLNGVPGKEKEG